MASKKDLKKDINFLTEETIEICFLHYYLKQNQEEEKIRINTMIEETIALRNELLNKINHPSENLDGKSMKAWYADILKEMMEKTDYVFEKLGQLDV
jgi:hypothetical protein